MIETAIREINRTRTFEELDSVCQKYRELFRKKDGSFPKEYEEIQFTAGHKSVNLINEYKLQNLNKGGYGMKDEKLDYFKQKIIAYLDKLDKENDADELQKSILFETIAKSRGYEVGTVREWKGKKYKKTEANKWVRVYDKDSTSAKRAIGQIKKMVNGCNTSTELLQLVLKYRDRFSDENGQPIPMVKELSDYVSKRSEELESNVTNAEPKKTEKKEPKTKDESYWIIDMRGNRVQNIEVVKRIKENLDEIDKLKERMEKEPKSQQGFTKVKINDLQNYNDYMSERLHSESDRKEIKAEMDKHKDTNSKADKKETETFESLTKQYQETKDPDEREKILNKIMELEKKEDEKPVSGGKNKFQIAADNEDASFEAAEKDAKEKYGNKTIDELQNLLDTKYKGVKRGTPDYMEAMKIGDMIQQKKFQEKKSEKKNDDPDTFTEKDQKRLDELNEIFENRYEKGGWNEKLQREQRELKDKKRGKLTSVDNIGSKGGVVSSVDEAVKMAKQIYDQYGATKEGGKKLSDMISYNIKGGSIGRLYDDVKKELGIGESFDMVRALKKVAGKGSKSDDARTKRENDMYSYADEIANVAEEKAAKKSKIVVRKSVYEDCVKRLRGE